MKKAWLLLLFTPHAIAAPFAITDPVASGVTHCGLYVDAAAKIEAPVFTDAVGAKICRFDLASLSVGNHALRVTAIMRDPTLTYYPYLESAQSPPLAFSKPGAPLTPAGLRLTP